MTYCVRRVWELQNSLPQASHIWPSDIASNVVSMALKRNQIAIQTHVDQPSLIVVVGVVLIDSQYSQECATARKMYSGPLIGSSTA